MSQLSLGLMFVVSIALFPAVVEAQVRYTEGTGGYSLADENDLAFDGTSATDQLAYTAGVDSDGDGVPDGADVCNCTPIGVAVDTVGRPLGDIDGDCDTDLIDYELFQSGFTGAVDPGDDHSCNPIAQTGCDPCEKCTFVPDDVAPTQWRTVCRSDGSVPSGGACTMNATTGVDDCEAGLFCSGGTCSEICSAAPDSCPSGQQCEVISGLVDTAGAGACEIPCDPLSSPSGCLSGEACYVLVGRETTACRQPAVGGTQGVDCEYINSCVTGYSCVLHNSPKLPTGMECAFICDASRSGGPTCADGPGSTFRCAQINLFYSDVPDLPDAYGMCIDPVEWSILDKDGDTVLDFNDLCPGTPPGTPVDANGCPL